MMLLLLLFLFLLLLLLLLQAHDYAGFCAWSRSRPQ
jgi:hypothetical protein